MLKHHLIGTPLLLLVAAAGCGSGPKVAPVTGKVTLDGNPLANAYVSFQPLSGGKMDAAGGGSYGTTGTDGSYTLLMVESDKPGAVIGKHRVDIRIKNEASDDRDPRLRPQAKVLPPRYNANSELTFDVAPGGTKEANF